MDEQIQKKIYILTEGGTGIGLGHVTRCLAIYQEMVYREIEAEMVVAATSVLPSLARVPHQLLDWGDFVWLDKKITTQDIVMIDSYLASLEIYNFLAAKCHQLWIIDDNCRLSFPDNARIVNPSLNAKEIGYSLPQIKNGLLGVDYAILRSDFLNAELNQPNRIDGQWLVTFGGMDLLNLTPRLISEMAAKYTNKNFKIIIAPDYHSIKEIQVASGHMPNVELLPYLSAVEMRQAMQESEGVICACGQTIYELLYVGVPFIPIQVVDNQVNNAKGLRQLGIPVCTCFEELQLQFDRMQNHADWTLGKLVDGKGVERIVDEIILQG